MARVGQDRPIAHQREVLPAPHVQVARGADEDLANCGGHASGHHPEAVHRCLQRTDGVDLDHRHVGTKPIGARRDASPDPAVAADHHVLPREQHVGRAQDPVDRALAGPVAVVEEVLGERLVDRDDGIAEPALRRHGPHADHAGGGLLGPTLHAIEQLRSLGVERGHQVGAIVHRHLRPVIQRRRDVPVVGVAVLAFDGDQRGRDVILRGERIARAEHHVGSARCQRPHQVRGLGGDVQAGADSPALERPLRGESLANAGHDRHLPVSPFDLPCPRVRQTDVGDVVPDLVAHRGSRCQVSRIASRMGRIRPHPPERRRPSRSTTWQYSSYPSLE